MIKSSLRVVIIGFGVQGKKRSLIASEQLISIVDPLSPVANFKDIKELSLNQYDAALVCTGDSEKIKIIEYLINNKKHVLVEKPLISNSTKDIEKIISLTNENKVACYTAYNHRFEPHFVKLKEIIQSKVLGKIYSCRMFYGNGTARLVKDSAWRDTGTGVLFDLGSHLLDTCKFWFEKLEMNFELLGSYRHENKSPDHVLISSENTFPRIELEMTLCMWKNHFTCDLLAERGSIHIESLCKWGPAKISIRKRTYPSGKPTEESSILVQNDPTWEEEYSHFKQLVSKRALTDLSNDIWINNVLSEIGKRC